MNPSIKRLLGALLLIGTLGVSAVMATRSSADAVSVGAVTSAPTISTGVHIHG